MTTQVLVAGATGDTGRAAVKEAVALGLDVRAMVRKHDARSEALTASGAEIVIGDLLEIDTVQAAMAETNSAYFVWPVQPGLIQAAVNSRRLQRKPRVSTLINLVATFGQAGIGKQLMP